MNIRRSITLFLAAIGMITLILDSRTALVGAAAGIEICVNALVPSLFPFFILSILLTSSLSGQPIPFLRPLAWLCRIPAGSESIMAIGFLGGYPVGAQNVVFAWEQGVLHDQDAQRMAVLCNNAGPAFIFGFLSRAFEDPRCPWLLWLIHISSAVLAAVLLPGGSMQEDIRLAPKPISLSAALDRSIHIMARVCGWVVLFRIILEFLQKWFFWRLPAAVQIVLAGTLELSNGCVQLGGLPGDGSKLLVSSVLLGFGGFCVFLQTHSIAKGLSLRLYLPGKLLHGSISFLLANLLPPLLLREEALRLSPLCLLITAILIFLLAVVLRKAEKPVAISPTLLYNQKSWEKRRSICCFGKKLRDPAPIAFTAQN